MNDIELKNVSDRRDSNCDIYEDKIHSPSKSITEVNHKIGTIDEAHDYMKHNNFIIRGYRINFDSGKKIIRSLFMLHNESVNVWTHLIGSLIILILLIYTASFINYNKQVIRDFDFKNIKINLESLTEPIYPNIKAFASSLYTSSIDYIKLIDKKTYEYSKFVVKNINCLYCIEDILNYIVKLKDITTSHINDSNALNKFNNIVNQKQKLLSEAYSQWSILNQENSSLDKWPLYLMLFGGILCLSFSATFHLFIAHSEKINNLLNRLDYAGISLLTIGTSYPPNYYLFNCELSKFNIYNKM